MEPSDKEANEAESKTRELLREWGFDPVVFEARAKRSLEGARGDLGEVTAALRTAMTSTRQTLLDLHRARRPVAAELKEGFERAWEEIEKAFGAARRKMRESRDEAAVETKVGPDV